MTSPGKRSGSPRKGTSTRVTRRHIADSKIDAIMGGTPDDDSRVGSIVRAKVVGPVVDSLFGVSDKDRDRHSTTNQRIRWK